MQLIPLNLCFVYNIHMTPLTQWFLLVHIFQKHEIVGSLFAPGEVQQLQWEMSRRDAERSALTSELSQLTVRVEEQAARLKEAETLHSQFQDLQHKYDALLQMYGEKVEEAQELQLDLEDVKEMYKTQVRWH